MNVNDSGTNQLKRLGRELVSGLTQFLVLKILKMGPQHGYELATILEPIYGRRLSPGTIYPLLKRMQKKDYLESRKKMVNGRQRRTYLLTRLGRIALQNVQSVLEKIIEKESSSLDDDTPGSELLKTLAQFRILWILDTSPMHGYELVDQLDHYFGQKIALGSIYPSLHRLESKGYIESKVKLDGQRERKVYDLTPKGKKAITGALAYLTKVVTDEIFK
jgi:DNA-binding PadR family transcriptional regulator